MLLAGPRFVVGAAADKNSIQVTDHYSAAIAGIVKITYLRQLNGHSDITCKILPRILAD